VVEYSRDKNEECEPEDLKDETCEDDSLSGGRGGAGRICYIFGDEAASYS
jgi:hypothetical protein